MLIRQPDNRGPDRQRIECLFLLVGQIHGRRNGLTHLTPGVVEGSGDLALFETRCALAVHHGRGDHAARALLVLGLVGALVAAWAWTSVPLG